MKEASLSTNSSRQDITRVSTSRRTVSWEEERRCMSLGVVKVIIEWSKYKIAGTVKTFDWYDE